MTKYADWPSSELAEGADASATYVPLLQVEELARRLQQAEAELAALKAEMRVEQAESESG